MTVRRVLAAAVGVVLMATLTACGNLWHTNDSGYISGDGHVQMIPAGQRGNVVRLTGTLLDGGTFDPSSIAGKVTVVNTWGAWCAECLTEAPTLVKAYTQATAALGGDVAFLGIDIRDSDAAQGQAFERKYGVAYPSIYSPDGTAVLAFSTALSPRTIPSTAVLDRTGRVAAIIRGVIPSALTLTEVVQQVAGEKS